ncbi:MAG: MBL fold metallo-hydrolase [Bacillota bacterium]|nr:MBL fold metallo-hydrolase [Bacillota bacterium]
MKIKFYGAARQVTGSNYLIEAGGKKLLLDCGLFQGGKEEDLLNYADFPYDPGQIDYLIVSHAHIDHIGRIPKLVKEGFQGRIFITKATMDLAKIMLQDSAHIQESDAEWENRKRERAGKELIEPLYTVDDAIRSFNYFEEYYGGHYIEIDETFTLRFLDAGHIIGSSIVELWIKEADKNTKLVYSGDLGVNEKALIRKPDLVESADILLMEATYGDRVHEPYKASEDKLIEIIEETAARGGSVIIPSFAVGRTQELIYQLNNYYDKEGFEEYKRIPIYVDSPMAFEATEAYQKNSDLFNDQTKEQILAGDNPFSFPNLRFVKTVEESMSLNKSNFPKVVISASGMADAGRIRHHLKHHIWDPKNTILFVGYQANGSTGRKILDGAKEIRLLGEEIQIRAEIKELQGLSAHADKNMLLDWLGAIKHKPKKIFLVHGELEAQENMKAEIKQRFNIEAEIPCPGEIVEIGNTANKVSIDQDYGIDLKESLDKSLKEVLDLMDAYQNQENKDFDQDFIKKNYSEYSDSLLEIKNRLMELIMIENQ